MASPAGSVFANNASDVRSLLGLFRALSGATTAAVDLTDLLRAAIVLTVSALDTYVHERVRTEMLEANRGLRVRTPAFEAFPIQMVSVAAALATPSSDGWLETEIRRQHSTRAFQKPDKIAEAFRLVLPSSVWDAASSDLGVPSADLRTRLDLIVDRRNKIAHEADLDPTTGTRWPISDFDVEQSILFVEEVVGAFERVI